MTLIKYHQPATFSLEPFARFISPYYFTNVSIKRIQMISEITDVYSTTLDTEDVVATCAVEVFVETRRLGLDNVIANGTDLERTHLFFEAVILFESKLTSGEVSRMDLSTETTVYGETSFTFGKRRISSFKRENRATLLTEKK